MGLRAKAKKTSVTLPLSIVEWNNDNIDDIMYDSAIPFHMWRRKKDDAENIIENSAQ